MATNDNSMRSVAFELIPATPEKYNTYYGFRSDKGDIYWTGYLTAPDYDKMKKLYLSRCSDINIGVIGSEKLYFLHVHADGLDEDVGYVLLYNKNDGFEFAYSVSGKYRGKGFGTKACELGTKVALKYTSEVYALVRDDNIASQRVFEKNGYVRTDIIETRPGPAFGMLKLRRWVYRKGCE